MARFKYLGVFFILLLIPVQASAKTNTELKPQAVEYNMQQAVEHALAANPSVEAKLLAVEKAKMDIGVAQSYFWPSVAYVANKNKMENSGGIGSTDDISNTNNGRGWRASLSLFAGLQHLNNIQKSFLAKDIEEARHRQAKLELIANVQLQFLHLLKAREDMKTVQDSKKRIDTQLKAAEAFVKVGMAPYLNVLQNEVEMSKVDQQEIRVANTIRNTEVMLNKYLGYDSDSKVEYKGNLKDFSGVVGYSEEEAIEVSLYSRPDLIIAQKTVAIALKQSEITAGQYLPSVNASYDNMNYSKNYSDSRYSLNDYNRSYWNIGLNFSWSLFDGGGTTFSYLGGRKAVASLRKEYEDATSSARADIIRALLDIQAAKDLISSSRKGVTAASESYAMANTRYKTNTGTITDLLAAQVRLTEAEADYSQSLMEFHSSRVKFFYNIGKENIALE